MSPRAWDADNAVAPCGPSLPLLLAGTLVCVALKIILSVGLVVASLAFVLCLIRQVGQPWVLLGPLGVVGPNVPVELFLLGAFLVTGVVGAS